MDTPYFCSFSSHILHYLKACPELFLSTQCILIFCWHQHCEWHSIPSVYHHQFINLLILHFFLYNTSETTPLMFACKAELLSRYCNIIPTYTWYFFPPGIFIKSCYKAYLYSLLPRLKNYSLFASSSSDLHLFNLPKKALLLRASITISHSTYQSLFSTKNYLELVIR